ncbi:hypothetical protein [Bradyrhizobium sp. LHD-71]|uniref:hypothetical protein n=1 Tax=Bradyrhizobium sp. LHD-71 TaxID=3072141 RepID=UPI0028107793|nr:hypothetical protein [Bradyrhizobium sp. LHD-71]MDQ8728083.1 hypothetical protein [Bradyrhizobium sp. LHD-71]
MKLSYCTLAGFLGLAVGTGTATLPISSSAEAGDYQASGGAPVAWRDFAERVQLRLRERLSDDEAPVRQFHRLLEDQAAIDAKAPDVVARIWVSSLGAVERLEVPGLEAELAGRLRGIMIGSDVRAVPPQGMLQPVHLRLSLGRAE